MSEQNNSSTIKTEPEANPSVNRDKLKYFICYERAAFIDARPIGLGVAAKSSCLNDNCPPGFWRGVPQHWMLDWPTPFPIRIKNAKGTAVTDIDGNELVDLCLGDTGAMFGHSPDAVITALRNVSESGLTAMLPSEHCELVGGKLVEVFGLPFWQMALSASDANRFALRVARLISKRHKILVFDGCYHGAVDETVVALDENGEIVAKPSNWGAAFDPAINTVCVPFNDLDALEAKLVSRDIACILMEPALTNCGIILPKAGYLQAVEALCKKYDTLLVLDETHTLSTGLGGYANVYGLSPDIFVAGKAVAGGVPCAIWGFNDKVKTGLENARANMAQGHSGVGTTLGGSLLALSAIKASLENLMTQEIYDNMIASSSELEAELLAIVAEFDLNWSIIRLGARLEIVFSKKIPANAKEMRATFDHELEEAIHLGLINRGFLATPFHNMLLAGPNLPSHAIKKYGQAMRQILENVL